jgi:hypothetical protein
MFSGGDYEEVARWLWNTVTSHAKREDSRIEAIVDAEGPRAGQSYAVRLRLGGRVIPALGEPAIELAYSEVAEKRGSLAWCSELAMRVRGLARQLAGTPERSRQPA